jgi:hypothetical protein
LSDFAEHPEKEAITEARRLIRQAAKPIGVRIRTVHVRHIG